MVKYYSTSDRLRPQNKGARQSDFIAHDVELDITDFDLDPSINQEFNLSVNVTPALLNALVENIRPHIHLLSYYQQDCYHLAIEILKTNDNSANQAAIAWLYEISETNTHRIIKKEIGNFLGFCQI